MKRFFSFSVVFLGILFLFTGCGSTSDTSTTNSSNSSNASASTDSSSTGATKEFSMTAKQFTFDPATLTVKKGDHVKISLTSADVDHGFSLSEFKVNTTISAGETKVIEFDATKSGTFTFVCSVVCGAGHTQMKGTLIVE